MKMASTIYIMNYFSKNKIEIQYLFDPGMKTARVGLSHPL